VTTRQAVRGFTLVELLIVVVIIGILSTFAIPSYRDYVRRSDRAAARTALLDNVQFLERTRTVSNSYSMKADGGAMDSASLPSQHAPKEGTARYDITVSNLTATTYTLTATPVAGGPQADDPCGEMTINELGVRGVAGSTVQNCWNR
jgi:type IV pilus assembly protein PilE